ncbi:MAG: hypothetical protein E7647_03540 [Ruminococcaceae bacterium]|nr:hypothetical protein [Oscillospiraceae bacterium]
MNRIKRIISLLAVVALVVSFAVPAYAYGANNSVSKTVVCGKNEYTVDFYKENGVLLADAEDLCEISGHIVSYKSGSVSFYISEPYVEAYSINLSKCKEISQGSYAVPFEEVSVALGIEVYDAEEGKIRVNRTPKHLIADMDAIYADVRYRIEQLLLNDFYWIMESSAKIYAILPFVGSGSLVGAITGSDEADRYENALSSIIASDEKDMTALLDAMGDISGEVRRNAEILEMVMKLTAKSGELYEYFESIGVSKEFLDLMAYEQDPYDMAENFFGDFSKVLGAINFDHFLDICYFYAVAMDAEESVFATLKTVFEDTDDEYIRKAVDKVLNYHYGVDLDSVLISDIYGGMAWDISSEFICDKIGDIMYGPYEAAIGLVTKVGDKVLQISEKSEAYMYFPIFASYQQDISSYYYANRNTSDPLMIHNLRSATVMFLKAAISAYKYAAFDKSLESVLNTAFSVLNSELANILSYTEKEYAPEYTNKEYAEYIGSLIQEDTGYSDGGNGNDTSEGDYITPAELCDGCWAMDIAGTSYSEDYYIRFYPDNTCEFIYYNGEYLFSETYGYDGNGELAFGATPSYLYWEGNGVFSSRNNGAISTFTKVDIEYWNEAYGKYLEKESPSIAEISKLLEGTWYYYYNANGSDIVCSITFNPDGTCSAGIGYAASEYLNFYEGSWSFVSKAVDDIKLNLNLSMTWGGTGSYESTMIFEVEGDRMEFIIDSGDEIYLIYGDYYERDLTYEEWLGRE